MKKISKYSLVLVVTLITMNMFAGTVDFTLDVKKEQGKLVTFALNQTEKIDLSIYDAEGKMIHSENVNSPKSVNRTYDLNALPEGTYFLEAESDLKVSRYEISVVGETALLSSDAVSEVYKPTFLNKNGLVWVNVLNLDKSPVSIKIYDNEFNEIYDSALLVGQNVTKVFDINNFQNEEYTFVITDNNKSFTKTFSKR
jgi:hypothetical protein